jgi:hypothetical protein
MRRGIVMVENLLVRPEVGPCHHFQITLLMYYLSPYNKFIIFPCDERNTSMALICEHVFLHFLETLMPLKHCFFIAYLP